MPTLTPTDVPTEPPTVIPTRVPTLVPTGCGTCEARLHVVFKTIRTASPEGPLGAECKDVATDGSGAFADGRTADGRTAQCAFYKKSGLCAEHGNGCKKTCGLCGRASELAGSEKAASGSRERMLRSGLARELKLNESEMHVTVEDKGDGAAEALAKFDRYTSDR